MFASVLLNAIIFAVFPFCCAKCLCGSVSKLGGMKNDERTYFSIVFDFCPYGFFHRFFHVVFQGPGWPRMSSGWIVASISPFAQYVFSYIFHRLFNTQGEFFAVWAPSDLKTIGFSWTYGPIGCHGPQG